MFRINKKINNTLYAIYIIPNNGTPDSKLLLKECAESYLKEIQYTGEKPDLDTVLTEEKGKPYFAHCDFIRFNIANCEDYWCCILSSKECGIDADTPKKEISGLADLYFSQEENQWLLKKKSDFLYLWTAKEACAKLTGEGLSSQLKEATLINKQLKYDPIERIFKGETVLNGRKIGFQHLDITPNVYLTIAWEESSF